MLKLLGSTPLKKLINLKAVVGGNLTEDTKTGNPASFTTDVAKKLKGLSIPFLPVQSGSGDPSPSNIRPITGWTGLNIYRSGEDTSDPLIIPVSWQTEAGEVYGGTLDALTGVLTVERACIIDDGTDSASMWSASVASGFLRIIKSKNSFPQAPKDNSTESLFINYMKASTIYDEWCAFIGSTGNFLAYVDTTTFPDKTAWIAYLAEHPIQICYEIATPFTVQLDPVTLSTLIGENNIWTDTSEDITVKYLKKG